MIKKCKVLIFVSVATVVLLIAFVVNAIWVNYTKQSRIEKAFSTMVVGDSKKDLVKKLGAPDEIEFCSKSDAAEAIDRECEEKYWYKVFISRWGFSFDKNGAVINKTHNVSY